MPLIRRSPPFEQDYPDAWVSWHAKHLDSLLKSTLLAFASMVPSMPGILGACAAVAYDATHRLWPGAALSALSMIPLAGYLPGAGKIVWNLRLIDSELRTIEDVLPRLHGSPELIEPIQAVIRTYFEKISKINSSLPAMKRLQAIMDAVPPGPEIAQAEKSKSTQSP
jgi:hypothetical protein